MTSSSLGSFLPIPPALQVDSLLRYIKERFPVSPGDIILTGTPHGVSAVQDGDQLVARVLTRAGAVISEGKWTAVKGA